MTSKSIFVQLPEDQHFEWPKEAEKVNNWEEAAKRWNILLHSSPTSQTILVSLINAHIQANNLEIASEILKSSADILKKNVSLYVYQAKIYLLQDKTDLANNLLITARANYPEKLQTWLQSTDYALHINDIKLAEKYNAEARLRFPSNFQALKQYAEIAMHFKQWQMALVRWSLFREVFPEHPRGFNQAAIAAEHLDDKVLARKLRLAREYGEELLITQNFESIDSAPKQHRLNTLVGISELVWFKALFNLRSETDRSYLSYIWWVLEPLLYVVVFYFVFGYLLQRGGEGFTVFLLTGLIPWMWFNKTIINSSNSIIAGKGLILNVGIPSIFFPLVTIVQSTLKQIPVFLILFAFVWLLGSAPELNWLNLLPVMFLQLLMTVCLGGFLAALVPFIRDISFLVPTGLTFIMFLSGTFFNYQQLPTEWHSLFLINPIAFILKCYRDILLEGIPPDFVLLSMWAVVSFIGCIFMLCLYQKLRYVFPKVVVS